MLGVGWSAWGAEAPRSPSREPLAPFVVLFPQPGCSRGAQVERGQEGVAGCGEPVSRRWGGGAFTGAQMQDLVNVKPHPVVRPCGGTWAMRWLC